MAEDDPWTGRLLLQRYRVGVRLRHDETSDLYAGENVRIGKRVAIRFLPTEREDDLALREAFALETKVAGAAVGPNVLSLVDAGKTETGVPFLVTELVDDAALAPGDELMPVGRVLRHAAEMAAGLETLHAIGPHGALGCESFSVVRLANGTEVTKLVDFGLGRSRPRGPTAAPDGFEGVAADIYSLGILIGWLATGTMPAVDRPSWVSGMPAQVRPIVERCTTSEPSERFASARAVENAVQTAFRTLRDDWSDDPTARDYAPVLIAQVLNDAKAPTPARTPQGAPAHLEAGFREPRDEYPFDVDEVLKSISPAASVKGIFLASVVERVSDRAELFARAGLPDRRISPFLDVPYRDYMRILVAAAEIVHPDVARTLALRRFHHSYYETFSETLAGRVIFGVMGRDASRVIPVGPKGWQVTVKHVGSVTGRMLAPRHARYTFADYPAVVCECCDVGVVEGALRFLGEPQGTVRLWTSGADTELDIRW